MKKVGFYKQMAAHRMMKANGIIVPSGINSHPMCRHCNKPIEVLEIKDRGPDPDCPKWFEIYAKCHGQESYCRVECPTPTPPDLWNSVISTGNFFDTSHEDDSRIR